MRGQDGAGLAWVWLSRRSVDEDTGTKYWYIGAGGRNQAGQATGCGSLGTGSCTWLHLGEIEGKARGGVGQQSAGRGGERARARARPGDGDGRIGQARCRLGGSRAVQQRGLTLLLG